MQAVVIASEAEQNMGPLTNGRSAYELPVGDETLIERAVSVLTDIGVDQIALNIDDTGLKSVFGADRGVDRVENDEVSIRFVSPRTALTAGLDQEKSFLCVRADMVHNPEGLEQLAETDVGFGYVSYANRDDREQTQGNVQINQGEVDDIEIGRHGHTGDFGAYAFKFPRQGHEWDYDIDPMAVELAHQYSPEAVEFAYCYPVQRPHQLLAVNISEYDEPIVHESAEVNGDVRGASIIGKDVVVDANATVERSILLEGVEVMPNSYVGDSIVGGWADIEEGTTFGHRTTNDHSVKYELQGTRLDSGLSQFGSIVGPRAQITAGETVEAGSVVGAGVTL